MLISTNLPQDLPMNPYLVINNIPRKKKGYMKSLSTYTYHYTWVIS